MRCLPHYRRRSLFDRHFVGPSLRASLHRPFAGEIMKVVIVDDMPLVLTLLQHLVSKLPGCEPLCFSDPLAALEWCMNNAPDLIVADFDMPQMDGAALLETVRLRHPDVPVLMITSSPAAELRYRV